MRRQGHSFATPIEAFDYIESKFYALQSDSEEVVELKAAVAEEEIRIATADLECYIAHVQPVVIELTERETR